MIKKAFIVAGALLTLYTVFLHYVKPHWSISQHRRQQNSQIKAEKYLYAPRQVRSVVVGSSLASHLKSVPGAYNLALSGQSALDGLAIVLKQAQPLDTVLIEINFIDREEDTEFTDLITNPILMPARGLLLSLRADKQPLAVVVQQVEMFLEPIFDRLTPASSGVPVKQKSEFEEKLPEQRRRYAEPPAAFLLEQQLRKLKQAVRLLEQRGARVIFFEMPVDYRLCDLPRARAIRAAFRRHFSPATYQYVDLPECAAYRTRDGVHLDSPSAAKYTQFLRAQLAKRGR